MPMHCTTSLYCVRRNNVGVLQQPIHLVRGRDGQTRTWAILLAGMLLILLGGSGCHTVGHTVPMLSHEAPRELHKGILPRYIIEPPDVLVIDAINVIPKSPYHLKTLDALSILVQGTLPEAPIDGVFPIEPGGKVNLGFTYGSVRVSGKTVEEAQHAVEEHLTRFLKEPKALVNIAELSGRQQITGEHLVGPDGTVTLGSYGSVLVVGMTIAEAKQAVEAHLSEHLDEPEVSLDVFAYNSKVYYVVTQGAGLGDGVYRFPVTGNETVLDAISQINGLEQVSSKRIWIARAGRDECGRNRVLPIDWNGITQAGEIETNYQLLPGDRVYIAEDKLIAFDTNLAKITAPLERIMGFSLLGVGTATRFSGPVLRGGGNRRGNF
jgi:polysaccharide export outer membrane protein